MNLTIDEIDKIDETRETILDVVAQETDWKNLFSFKHKDKDFNDMDADVQNIEGKMRVRISDLLRELVNESIEESWTLPEDREPEFDPHDLD